MEISLRELPFELRVKIKSILENAKTNGTYLKSSNPLFPKISYLIFLLFTFFLLSLYIISSWMFLSYFLIASSLVIFFFIREIQVIFNWIYLGRDSVFFDSNYFVCINNSELTLFQLKNFVTSERFLYRKKVLASFSFQNSDKALIYSNHEDKDYLNFVNSLKLYAKQVSDFNKYDIEKYFRRKIFVKHFSNQKYTFILSAFILLILYFTVPILIDNNQFENAKNINTPSSFREYLSEKKNVLFRDEARVRIKSIYNQQIDKYIGKYRNLEGSSVFKEVLEYLRDRDFYYVQVEFNSKSNLEDISNRQLNIMSILPSFTHEKNLLRQKDALAAINSSLGKIFPTDIITFSDSVLQQQLPKIEIFYTYENNPDKLYFPTEQRGFSQDDKTYYYGLKIFWNFKLLLPTQKEPIFEFNLISEPLNIFTSKTLTSDDIYAGMANSAFKDFISEFDTKFYNTISND